MCKEVSPKDHPIFQLSNEPRDICHLAATV